MATENGKDHEPGKAHRWISHEVLLLLLTFLVLGFVLYNL